jgi:ubiquinol-cytochrome c reductase cytochrome b subunit
MSAPPNTGGRPAVRLGERMWGGLAWLEKRLNVTELFSFLTHFGVLYTPVDTQRPLREVLREIGRTPIVSYARWPHILGLLTGILFALQAISGTLLAFYYQPTALTAYASTRSIVRDVPLGWLVHQVHGWGSYLLMAVVLVRILRMFWDGLHRAPREVLWFSATALGYLVIQLDFTGRLLPWDVQSYWAAIRGLEVISSVPLIGPLLAFVVGGRTLSQDSLIRFYVLHSLVLPALYVGMVWVTFATMRRVGLSRGDEATQRTTTFRKHVSDLLIIMLLLFAGLVTLATLVPFHFHGAADPYVTPKGIHPPWYMLALYASYQVPLPKWIPGLFALALSFAIPFLPVVLKLTGDRLDEKRLRLAGLVAFGLWTALTVVGAVLDRS